MGGYSVGREKRGAERVCRDIDIDRRERRR